MAGLALIQSLASDGAFSDHFELGKQFARGAFSVIHSAAHKLTKESYVVKIVPLEEDDEIQEVAREVQFFKDNKHPNLVGFQGAWIESGKVHMVLESCAVGSLASIYNDKDQGFDEDFIRYMVHETLQGLKYLHDKGIVHRDLKCANVLMTVKGEIKIADFGTHGRVTPAEKRYSLVGTPHWMAPEVCENNTEPSAYDTAADIWSLGITCIEAAEIDPPHGEHEPLDVIDLIPLDDPPTFNDISPWSPEFIDFVDQCLIKDPVERPSAAELLKHPFLEDVDMKSGKRVAVDILMFRERMKFDDDDEAGYPSGVGPLLSPKSTQSPKSNRPTPRTPAPEASQSQSVPSSAAKTSGGHKSSKSKEKKDKVRESAESDDDDTKDPSKKERRKSKSKKTQKVAGSVTEDPSTSSKTNPKPESATPHRTSSQGETSVSPPSEGGDEASSSSKPGRARSNTMLDLSGLKRVIDNIPTQSPSDKEGETPTRLRLSSSSVPSKKERRRSTDFDKTGPKKKSAIPVKGGTSGGVEGLPPLSEVVTDELAGDLISPRAVETKTKPKIKTFTLELPYGAKKTVFFVAEKPLRKIYTDLMDYRNLEMDDYELVNPDGTLVDLDLPMGQLPDIRAILREKERRRAKSGARSSEKKQQKMKRDNPRVLADKANRAKFRQMAIQAAALMTKQDLKEFQKLSEKQNRVEQKTVLPLKAELEKLEQEYRLHRKEFKAKFREETQKLTAAFESEVSELQEKHAEELRALIHAQDEEAHKLQQEMKDQLAKDNADKFSAHVKHAERRGELHMDHLELRFELQLRQLREVCKLKRRFRVRMAERFEARVIESKEDKAKWLKILFEHKLMVKEAQNKVLLEFEKERHELKVKQVRQTLIDQQKEKRDEFARVEAEMKKRFEEKLQALKDQDWEDKKDYKVEHKRISEKYKSEERERKEWFEKHLKAGLEKQLEGLEAYQHEEAEVTEKNLHSSLDKERDKFEKDIKDLEEQAAKKLEFLKVKHALEYLQERFRLNLAENDLEFERDNNGAFANYEQQKKMSIMDVARIDTMLKEAQTDEDKKKFEEMLIKAKKDIDEVTSLYEEDKKMALEAKEAFAAELRFLKYAKLNETELLKAYRVGEPDDEEESEELTKKTSHPHPPAASTAASDAPKLIKVSLEELQISDSEGELPETTEESEMKTDE